MSITENEIGVSGSKDLHVRSLEDTRGSERVREDSISYFCDDSGTGSNQGERKVDEVKILKSQEKLIEMVKDTEKDYTTGAKLRPCDSCEFPDPYGDTTTCCWCPGLFRKKHHPLHEFWLISTPVGDPSHVPLEKLNAVTEPQKLSTNYKFHMPRFHIGNLNQMLELTDLLSLLDSKTEGLVRKLSEFMYVILEEVEHISEYFEVNNVDILTYITRFTWNGAKYPAKKPLPVIYSRIKELIDSLDVQMTKRIHDYNELDRTLTAIIMQQSGNLATCSLHGIIRKEDVILGSEYITSLFVVVPNSDVKRWLKCYETLADLVVPQSTVKIAVDDTYALFSVAVWKKSVELFSMSCVEKKFIVRDFKFEDSKRKEERDKVKKLYNLRRAQIAVLYRWIKVNFSESFSAWIHIKALRLFVESVLKYGLHVDFEAILLIPLKSTAKLKNAVNKLFDRKESRQLPAKVEDIPWSLTAYEIPEYLDYVFIPIKIDIFGNKHHSLT